MNKGKLPLPGEDMETEMFDDANRTYGEAQDASVTKLVILQFQVTNQSIISSIGKMQRMQVLVQVHMAM